jgi:hypothetical protein
MIFAPIFPLFWLRDQSIPARRNMSSDALDLFPRQTPSYILSFQFSSWYPTFVDVSIKSTVIRPLPSEFKQYLESESVFVPDGSENACVSFPHFLVAYAKGCAICVDPLRARSLILKTITMKTKTKVQSMLSPSWTPRFANA